MNNDFDSIIPKRYAGLVGLGLMFLWGSAFLTWMNLWQSTSPLLKTLGALGLLVVTASGIAIAFYTNGLEQELKKSIERGRQNAADAQEYRSQAKNALKYLESRGKDL